MTPTYKSILQGAGIFGAAKAVGILTALVRTKCAALLLGPVGVGLNALFYTVQLFSSQLMGLGLSTGSVKTLSEAYASGDAAYIEQHVTLVRRWGVLCGMAAIVLLSLLAPLLSWLYFDSLHYVPHFVLLGVGVAALIITEIEQSVMRSLQATRRLALSMLLVAVSALLFTVPFYWWLGMRGIIFAIVSCAVASAVISLWLGHQVHPFRASSLTVLDLFSRDSAVSASRRWRSFWTASQPMLRMGLAFVATGLFLQGTELILQSTLAMTASLAVVGLFKTGYQCAYTYPSMIFSGVVNDYFPRLAAVPDGDAAGRRIVVVRQIRVMFLLSLPVVIGIWVLAPWVIRLLLSGEFITLVPMVRWAILAMLCKAVYLPLGYIPLALGKRRHFMLLECMSCLVHLVVVLVGYRLNGIEGIGQGILVGGILDLLLYVVLCRRWYGGEGAKR